MNNYAYMDAGKMREQEAGTFHNQSSVILNEREKIRS